MDKKIKVLVVDDESDFRQLMVYWLESKGYAAIEASGGEIAIKLAKEEKPDVIFMDLRMPVMDGVETIKRIRQFDKEVPIIVISAYVEDPSMGKVGPYGISGLFYKGKDFNEGLLILESALRTHKKLKS